MHLTDSDAKYIRALKLLKSDLEYPNRELRMMAIVDDCQDEVARICTWLLREIEREIELQEMFNDAFNDVGDEPPRAVSLTFNDG